MKKFLTLFAVFALTANAWADLHTYCAISSASVSEGWKVQVNFNTSGGWTGWLDMSKTSKTYDGKDVYEYNYSTSASKMWDLQFRVVDGETQKSFNWPINNTETNISDVNNRIHVYDQGWGRTLFFQAIPGNESTWGHHIFFDDEDIVLDLAADKEYSFLIVDNSSWYKANSETALIATSPAEVLSTENTKNVKVKTSIAAEYSFSWNGTTKTISVVYPTTYSRSDITASGIWGTICLPVDGAISNATLYSIEGKFDGKLYLSSGGTTLTAGMPYLFKSTASAPSVVLANTVYEATPLSEGHTTKGLYGRYTDQSFEGWNSSTIYVVRNEEIQKAMTGTGAGNFSGIYANRAFIEMNRVPNLDSAPSAPAMHFVIDESNGATSVDAIEASKKAVKFIENGKLFIQKNGVVYDTTGRVVR